MLAQKFARNRSRKGSAAMILAARRGGRRQQQHARRSCTCTAKHAGGTVQSRASGAQAPRRDLQCPGPARLRRVSVGSAHVPAQRHRVQQARSRATHRLAAQCTVRRGNTSPNLRYSSEIPEIQTPAAVYTSSAADFIVNTRAKPAPCCLASRAQIIYLSTSRLWYQ